MSFESSTENEINLKDPSDLNQPLYKRNIYLTTTDENLDHLLKKNVYLHTPFSLSSYISNEEKTLSYEDLISKLEPQLKIVSDLTVLPGLKYSETSFHVEKVPGEEIYCPVKRHEERTMP